jgi:hypothetical protein
LLENSKVVMKGSWTYGGTVKYLQLIKSDVLYGSGDYEDPPEIRNDKEIECYYIEFLSSTQKDKVDSTSGGFLILAEAIIEAEELTNQKVSWMKI